MSVGIRSVLSVLTVAFTAYLAVGALLWTTPPARPLLQIAAVACYLVTTWLCTFWKARPDVAGDPITGELGRSPLLPGWAAALALATAVVMPNASWLAVAPEDRLRDYATWSMGAIGALMAIVMVRRRPRVAWAGVAVLAVQAAAWIGIADALALGVVGAVLWVGVAQLLMWLVDRAAQDTAELAEVERAASEWLAAQEGRRVERRTLVQRALALAGPVLTRTIESQGRLDDAERDAARIAEAALRDELRAAALLDDVVRGALAAARARGTLVSVLDEGGLEELSAAARTAIRQQLAAVLAGADSERLYVRASRHDEVAVTVVGRSAGDDGEDRVDLWREIPRRPAEE
ncbi:hypothetical protein [Microbacterium sp.]|uniref:hypothetical protein n=1 Tax=Microbacterium sp. TaxID=51671 RepID=UPI0039E33FF7